MSILLRSVFVFLAFLSGLSAQSRIRFAYGGDIGGASAFAVAAGRFAGTSTVEIAILKSFPNAALICTSTSPTTVISSIPLSGLPLYASAVNVDGDSDDDLAVVTADGVLHVLRNNGVNGFSDDAYPLPTASPVISFDHDGDGDWDLIVARSIFINDGTGTFVPGPVLSGANSATELLPGDFDGDGDTDFAAVYPGQSATGPGLVVRVFRRNAAGTHALLSSQRLADIDPTQLGDLVRPSARIADMNGDGVDDIVASFSESSGSMSTTTFLGSPSSSFTAAAGFRFRDDYSALDVADVDGDGDIDVIEYMGGNNFFSLANLLANDGQGNLSKFSGHLVAEGYLGKGLFGPSVCRDFNDDGKPDLLLNAKSPTSLAAAPNNPGTLRLLYGAADIDSAAERVRFLAQEEVRETLVSGPAIGATPQPVLPSMIPALGQLLTPSFVGNLSFAPPTGSTISPYINPIDHTFWVAPTAPGNSVFKVKTSDDEEFRLYVACGPTLAYRSGDRQTTGPGEPFAKRLIVRRLSPSNAPIVGETVTFTSIGSVPVSFSTNDHPHTDANGFARVSAVAGASLGAAKVRAMSSAGYSFDFDLSIDLVPHMMKIGGDDQLIRIDDPTTEPLVCRLTDYFGSPIVGEYVVFSKSDPSSGIDLVGPTVVTTDSAGECLLTFNVNQIGGESTVIATSASGAMTTFTVFVRKLQLSIGAGEVTVIYDHEHAGIPLILRAGAPLPAPGYVESSFGRIFTNLANPGVDFVYLDGWGLYGPVDPTMITNTSGTWGRTFTVPSPAVGLPFVIQIGFYDWNYEFPTNIGFSNPLSLTL